MEYVTPLIDLVSWAAKNGVISATTAIGIVFLIYAHTTTQKTFKDTVKTITEQNDKTIAAQQSQIEDQKGHIDACEERYSILRTDVTEMQKQVNEQANWMLQTVLGDKKNANPGA